MSDVKKPLSKSQFQGIKSGDEERTKTLKGKREKLKTKEALALTTGKDLEDKANLRALHKHADGLRKLGKVEEANAIAKKALNSKAAKRLKDAASSKAAKKISSKLFSSIPIIGGVIAAAQSGDVSAAVPGLGDVEKTGPERGSAEESQENPKLSKELRKKAMEKLRKKSGFAKLLAEARRSRE